MSERNKSKYRLDRLITLYGARPLSRCIRSFQRFKIPILMYHSISNHREGAVHPYYQVNTSPAVFAEHMKYLSANHFKVITLQQLIEILHSNQPSGSNYVAITFDDGFRDFNEQAFPILQQYGFPATVFLPAGLLGDRHQIFNGKELLTWGEVRDLRKEGVVFGSHSMTHRELKLIGREEVKQEIEHSKEILEDKLGEKIDSFSYPYAFPQEDKEFMLYLKEILVNSGYRYGVSTRIGTTSLSDSGMFMKRIPINSLDDLALLKAKLEGSYDWLSAAQYLVKSAKGALGI